MANKTILGIKAVKSAKTQKVGYTYYFSEPFSDYENESAEVCEGLKCGNVFAYRDYSVKPGDVVNMMYEPGYEGKAVLTDIVMVKPYVPVGK